MDKAGFVPYLQTALQRRGFEKAVGAKFLYAYFRDEYIERHCAPELKDVYRYLVQAKDIKIIHLWRNNPLRILVSFEIAERTKEFVAHDQTAAGKAVNLSLAPEFVKNRVDEILIERDWAMRTFSDHPVFELSYEDLVDPEKSCVADLLKFLNVDLLHLGSSTKRQNSRKLSEILDNYDELRQHFAGTEIERYLAS